MRVTALAVAAALTLAVATGCAGNKPQHQDGAAAPAGAPSSSAPTTVETPAQEASSPVPTGTTTTQANASGPTPKCRAGQLDADIEQYTPAGKAGSEQDARVRFTNSGDRCTMSGYVGIQLFAGTQARETKATQTNGPPKTVTIERGQTAWAQIMWVFQPAADEQDKEPICGARPTAAALTPPGQSESIRVNEQFGRVCNHGEIYMFPITATRPG